MPHDSSHVWATLDKTVWPAKQMDGDRAPLLSASFVTFLGPSFHLCQSFQTSVDVRSEVLKPLLLLFFFLISHYIVFTQVFTAHLSSVFEMMPQSCNEHLCAFF